MTKEELKEAIKQEKIKQFQIISELRELLDGTEEETEN